MSHVSQERRFPEWDQRYVEQPVESMPWFHPELDGDVGTALARWNIGPGRALDLGTGPGTQAIELAERGFTVTGTDISPTAIDKAQARAQQKGVRIAFRQDDILASKLDEEFDLVFDRGCFHVLAPDRRGVYVQTIHRLMAPAGFLLLKTFSKEQPGVEGPFRFDPSEIESMFSACFDVLSVEQTVYQGTLDPLPKALFCVMRKR